MCLVHTQLDINYNCRASGLSETRGTGGGAEGRGGAPSEARFTCIDLHESVKESDRAQVSAQHFK
jgi:hypothetical protein